MAERIASCKARPSSVGSMPAWAMVAARSGARIEAARCHGCGHERGLEPPDTQVIPGPRGSLGLVAPPLAIPAALLAVVASVALLLEIVGCDASAVDDD